MSFLLQAVRPLIILCVACAVYGALRWMPEFRRTSAAVGAASAEQGCSALSFEASTLEVDVRPPPAGRSGPPFAEYVFSYRDKGPGPVTITDVRTTCACTSAAPEPRTLAPGGSGKLRVTMKVTSVGDSQQQVLVRTDDSPTPLLLVVKAHYDPPADAAANPPFLSLGDGPADLLVTISSKSSPPDLSPLPEDAPFRVEVVRDEVSAVRTVGGRFERWIALRVRRGAGSGCNALPGPVSDPASLTLRFSEGLAPLVVPVKGR